MKFDALQIVEDSKCCLKVNAVITKEGVYQYPDGRAYKCRMELLKATHTARNAKLTILDHPESLVIMSQAQIHGVIEKPFFDRNKMRAQLNFDKSVCPKDFVDSVRAGAASKDVSIGFYYQPDMTSGSWVDEQGIKHPYDYIMRDIVIDHVAVGVLKGRCSYPDCGIGVDAVVKQLGFKEDKVEQRGNQWCVVHCHGEEAGTIIKCFDTRAEAELMHKAIQAQKDDKIEGGKKLLSEKEYEEFKKDHMAHGYTEQQAKDYWDTYVVGTQPLLNSPPPTPPPVAKPLEVVAKPPEPTANPIIPSPPIATPPPENLTSEQLIDRSKELLAMREQSVIEKNRNERRHPL